eukprot:TRINITY_DN955_c0_g1_i1.p1 TRINITY_DN955_c0_g1~~TRINITY_DN955_c0_g1_i1.p1  ORF type:complete len:304 (-),score=55.66 TRINITY_DN955_c0_g1_i1:65-931(-)
MKTALLFILLLAFIQSIYAQCSTLNNNCTACSAAPNCGYCYATGICQTGSYSGPSNGFCLVGWYYGDDTCPDCTKQTSCNGCNQTPSCAWCGDTQKCVAATDAGGCMIDHQCDCRTHGHCQRCLADSKCTWCAERNTCEDLSASTCTHSLSTCPNCSSVIDCETCNFNWGCNWCVENKTSSCQASSQCLNNQVATCTSICNTLTDCGYCTRASGCGWCEATASCYGGDAKDTTCLLTHTCKNMGSSFRAGSFVGGMFLSIGLGLVGGVIYFVYTRRQKQSTYDFNNNL